MITVYAETPLVLQIALGQEAADGCQRLLDLASNEELELAVPRVSVVETLYVWRRRANERRELMNELTRQANELERTDFETHRSAVESLRDANLHVADLADDEREELHRTTQRLFATARLIDVDLAIFDEAYRLENEGLTSVDALAIAAILADARSRDEPRKFLSLDRKAINASVRKTLTDAGVGVCTDLGALAGWLSSHDVKLEAATSDSTTRGS